jgi:hypothetical protein
VVERNGDVGVGEFEPLAQRIGSIRTAPAVNPTFWARRDVAERQTGYPEEAHAELGAATTKLSKATVTS